MEMKKNKRFTRGSGLLENYLARKRARKADSLISDKLRSGRVLDIGCGSSPCFLIKTEFKEKYGVDPVLGRPKLKGVNLKALRFDGKKLPYKNDYFNVVTMLAVFEHIEEQELQILIKEIKRVLAKDGLFIMTTPSPWSSLILKIMERLNLISKEEIDEHKHNHKRKEITKVLREGGFDKSDIKSGYFEIFCNMWFVSKK